MQPDEHWHLLLAYQIRSDQGVSHAIFQRHIAGHHSHRAHGAVRVVEGHDQRDRIIRSGVGVDHEAAGPVSHRVASHGQSVRADQGLPAPTEHGCGRPDACLDGVNQGLSGRQRSSRAADERVTGPGRVDH